VQNGQNAWPAALRRSLPIWDTLRQPPSLPTYVGDICSVHIFSTGTICLGGLLSIFHLFASDLALRYYRRWSRAAPFLDNHPRANAIALPNQLCHQILMAKKLLEIEPNRSETSRSDQSTRDRAESPATCRRDVPAHFHAPQYSVLQAPDVKCFGRWIRAFSAKRVWGSLARQDQIAENHFGVMRSRISPLIKLESYRWSRTRSLGESQS
jgi:hypothetical protein